MAAKPTKWGEPLAVAEDAPIEESPPVPVPEETPKEEKAPEPPAAEEAPHVPTITVDQFVSRSRLKKIDPVVIAFVSSEKRTNSVRKLAADEWQAHYDAFLNAPR